MLGNILNLLNSQGIARRVVGVADHRQGCLGIIYFLNELTHIQAVVLRTQLNNHAPCLGSLGIDVIHGKGRLRISNSQIPATKSKKQLFNNLAGTVANQHIFLLQPVIGSDCLHQLLQILIGIAVKGNAAKTPHHPVLYHGWQIHAALVGIDLDFPLPLYHIIGWHAIELASISQFL